MALADVDTWREYKRDSGTQIEYEEYLALRAWWRSLGGSFHGPNIETATMPEFKLIPILQRLNRTRALAVDGEEQHG